MLLIQMLKTLIDCPALLTWDIVYLVG